MAGAAVLSCFFALAASPDAQAKLTCSYDDTSHVLSVSVAHARAATIRREHRTITVNGGLSGLTHIYCAGLLPTIRNTDAINIVQEDERGTVGIRIDLASGPLAPGRSPEADGSPEIEINVEFHDRYAGLHIYGSNRSEEFVYGRSHRHPAFNLDAAVRGDHDLDLTTSGKFADEYLVIGDGGADTVAPEPGARVGRPGEDAAGSAGPDRLLGTGGIDLFGGGHGSDLLAGRGGNDYLTGGGGRDRVLAGAGNDNIWVRDSAPDTVNCGPGNDWVLAADPGDHLKGCETVFGARPRRATSVESGGPLDLPRLLRR